MKISSSIPSAAYLLIIYCRKSSLWKCGTNLCNPALVEVVDASSCVDPSPLIVRHADLLASGDVRSGGIHRKPLTCNLWFHTSSVLVEPIPLFNQREIRLRPLLREAVHFLLLLRFLYTRERGHGTYRAINSGELPLLHKTGSSSELTQGLEVRAVLNHHWRLLIVGLWLLHHPILIHLLDSLLQERL